MRILKKACVFIGMAVGAGFASGREITDYFLKYGENWKLMVAFSGLLFFAVVIGADEIISKKKVKTYSEYLITVMGKKTAIFTEWVSGLFFFAMFFAMTSASGTAAEEMFGLDYMSGVLFTLALSFIVMVKGIKAVETLSIVIVPFLMVGICIIGRKCGVAEISNIRLSGGIKAAVIYVSYNTISTASLMIQSERRKNKTDSIILAAICGLTLTVMGIMIGNAILTTEGAFEAEFPFAAAARRFGGKVRCTYSLIFILSVLTTAICDAVAGVDFLKEKTGIGNLKASIIITIGGVVFSQIKFSEFVSTVYPLFGIAGIMQFLGTLLFLIRKK